MVKNNTILISKYIYLFLMENEELAKMVGDKIFPLQVNKEVNFPFIIYGKEGITPNYVKNYAATDTVNLVFDIVSDSYADSLEIANQVRYILENKRFENDEIRIIETRVDNITEACIDNAYVQTIYLHIVCSN